MVQVTERGLACATAKKVPEGADTVILPLDMLDPITKIFEPTFYEFVKESLSKNGMYHPLIITPITVEEWDKEAEVDKDMFPPPTNSNPLRYRIQCGCNRYFALKELGYDAVECIVVDKVEDARLLCQRMRVDKRWQRGSSWVNIPGERR